jgi:hypothetical protein
MTDFLAIAAKRIPEGIRKKIMEEGLLDKANTIQDTGSPMEYLFDVFEEFVDVTGEHDDWNCWQCRQAVLTKFIALKPYL